MSELVLYDGAHSPSGRRVKLCLFEKGLSFKIRWLNLALMDQKEPSYLKINPTGSVPALLHDGKALYESNVINEYLNAVFPTPSLAPKDAWGQAQMRMWFAFENDFARPFRDALFETFGKDRLQSSRLTPEKLDYEISRRTSNIAYVNFAAKVLTTPRNDALIEDSRLILMEKMELMEERLSDGRSWLCGEQFTLADIAVAPRIDMFPIVGIPDVYRRFPCIGQFIARLKSRPSWEKSAILPGPAESERTVAIGPVKLQAC